METLLRTTRGISADVFTGLSAIGDSPNSSPEATLGRELAPHFPAILSGVFKSIGTREAETQ